MVAEWPETSPEGQSPAAGWTQMEKLPEIVKAVIKSETLQEAPDGSPERVVWPSATRVMTWVKGQEHCLREPNTKM